MPQVHIHLHRATRDAGFEESKHPRASDGKFGSGGGSGKEGAPKEPKGKTFKALNGKHTKPGGNHPDKVVLYDKQGAMHTVSRGLGENRVAHEGWKPVPAEELNKKTLL